MAYATISDIEARLGRALTPSEITQAQAWIADVEAQIEHRISGFADLVAAGTPSPAIVRAVVSEAVIRVLRNPEGVRERTVSIDDYSESMTVDSVSSAGVLYLTDEQWNLLSPGSSGDAFSIRLHGVSGYRLDGAGIW